MYIRELGDTTKIDIEVRGIIFKETSLLGIFLSDVKLILEGKLNLVNQKPKFIKFDEHRNIIDLGNTLVIEYTDEQKREKDRLLFGQSFIKDGYFAKELEEGRQFPECEGYFEYNGKFYLIMHGYNKTTEEINEFAYKGIIIDIEKYSEPIPGKENVTTLITGVNGSVKDLTGE
ncbi:MAG: hypothetical protein PHF46_02805 [Candidatus Gracilibacteria bacterium]|nr:hypothetical protein [Candidatus Gracilibacteria bacterium]MDD3120313.1 hypothetical protein [Candidatus Gracilibacteria bacterium]